ncbi:MAG TPA: ATP-binding protein, partial [Ktedonobacterales bacterium]
AWQARRVEVAVEDLSPQPPPLRGEGEPEVDPTPSPSPARGRGEAEADPTPSPSPLRWRGEPEGEAEKAPLPVGEGLERGLALADAGRLQQILQNLLHNAVRHTPPGGIVAVSAVTCDEYTVALRVRDTGEGIAPDDLPHIWERFYRTTAARQRDGQAEPDGAESGGTGLGLALVKELAEAMGGSVAVESVPGEGSSFTVRLPRAPRGVGLVESAVRAQAKMDVREQAQELARS